MIKNLTNQRPGKRAVITLVLLVALSFSALMVGNFINTETSYSNGGSVASTAGTPQGNVVTLSGSGFSADGQYSVASMASGADVEVYYDIVSVADLSNDITSFESRMVVYSARIGLKVDDVDETLDVIKTITDDYGGFISTINTRDDHGSVTIRVPQNVFHNAISDLEVLGEVSTRDLQGEDVTEEFVDLEAQLTTLTHQEARLYEIMEMGTTVEEVLDVERELERVRGRIESIQGRIQFLTNRVSLSTITVNLFVEEEEVEIEVKLAWFPEVDWSEPVRTGLAVVTTVA